MGGTIAVGEVKLPGLLQLPWELPARGLWEHLGHSGSERSRGFLPCRFCAGGKQLARWKPS